MKGGGDSKNVGKHCTGATVLRDPFATKQRTPKPSEHAILFEST